MFNIGMRYNNIVKSNINYDRRAIVDFYCAAYIDKLLNEMENYMEDMPTERLKLQQILNNLILL